MYMKKHLFTLLLVLTFLPNSFTQHKITLNAIYKDYIFYPKTIEGIRSMMDGEHYTTLNQFFYIDKYSYETGDYIETLFSVKDIQNPPFDFFYEYTFNADESKLLITTEIEAIYRHSFKANYYIFDLITRKLEALSEMGKQQAASFSPDGNIVAFVRDNNIFIKNLQTRFEKQITFNGERNKIINGIPDWVYEEEFGYNKAYDWSSDSKKIAYCMFDESHVREFNMTLYGNLYPEWFKYKYPKAGERNSIVNVMVYNLDTDSTLLMDTGEETDQYIPRIKWTCDKDIVSIIRLNRLQNKLDLLHANANTGKSLTIYTEEDKYYIPQVSDKSFIYLADTSGIIFTSEKDGWKHIYYFNPITQESFQITKGMFDTGEILSIDQKNELIYYSSHEGSALNKHIYKIQFDGTKKKKISISDGWNEAEFSNNSKYFILTHSTANTPEVYSVFETNGKLIRVLENNSELLSIRKKYEFGKKEFFNFKTSSNVPLNGFMIKPDDFSSKKKYPVLMYVYGGPESQNVMNKMTSRDNWFQMLAQEGYIIVCVDNRGTNNQGVEFRKSTYMQLGKLETEDQIEAAKYLAGLSYVDANRIGIFGWSYGGYLSLLCLAKGADVFSMAISVAPVTNWRFYDTIYTERFMRLPQDNPQGYDDNSPINHVEKIKGKLLLVHGMADDNVHLQNTTELISSLVEKNKQFELMVYPNKNHGIYGGNTTYHLYTKMTNFILNNL
jgi:dipeptidyl-peptidase 4